MKILFVWTGLTSYMADCWQRLVAEQGVELKVVIDVSGAGAKSVDFDSDSLLAGIPHVIFAEEDWRNEWNVIGEIVEWKPDTLFVVGWRSALCRSVVEDARLKDVPKVCCFDMPWRWKVRCLVAPLVLGRFLRHYQAAFVPGAVCARYAKWLGFGRIYQGLFAIDTERFSIAGERRSGDYFLYIGRNSAEKRLDDLKLAHRLYRDRGGRLELRLYGKGLPGGFVAPGDVPVLMRGAAAFVLASDFDPWPLVLLEAMSAGCPVIASDQCTNRPELGKNWRVFHVGDVHALARELSVAEKQSAGESHAARCAENLALARHYDCRDWVKRVKTILAEVVE